MKRKGVNNQTIGKYFNLLVELKELIDSDSKTKGCTDLIQVHRCSKHILTFLKKSGIVTQNKQGLFWVGGIPSIKMVIDLTELRHQYHEDLNRRKRQKDLFSKPQRTRFNLLNNEKPMDRIPVDDEQIETKPIKDLTQEDLERWQEKYKKQIAVKSDTQIKQCVEVEKPLTWIQKLIKSIFKIK